MASEETGLVRGTYGTRLAAKLSGLTVRQVRYWVATDLIEPSVFRASRGGRDLFSYLDLVELRVISRLRKRTSLPNIRRAVAYLREVLPADEAWHTKSLVIHGRNIVALMGDDDLRNLTHQSPGQAFLSLPMSETRDDIERAGKSLSIGDLLEVNSGVQGGAPVLRGTRIPTSLIGELLKEGLEPTRIRTLYPGVTDEAITAAQEFERQLAAV